MKPKRWQLGGAVSALALGLVGTLVTGLPLASLLQPGEPSPGDQATVGVGEDPGGDSVAYIIENPYRLVDWERVTHHKAALHTHTRQSDGLLTVPQVIDGYQALGFTVLALTDHDTRRTRQTTWPWSAFDRDPEQLGMVAIQGNELSRHHHMGSYFCGFGATDQEGDEHLYLEEVGKLGGLAIFFHPGRFHKPDGWEWYVPFFRRHAHLIGMEIHNQGDRYPDDRALWDAVLLGLMPDRVVWGVSSDDSYHSTHMGRNWNVLLLEVLSEEQVRSALVQGMFYAVYKNPRQQEDPPGILAVTEVAGEAPGRGPGLSVTPSTGAQVVWISGGRVIHRGEALPPGSLSGLERYVRAQVEGPGGVAYTNPFGIRPARLEVVGAEAGTAAGAGVDLP